MKLTIKDLTESEVLVRGGNRFFTSEQMEEVNNA